MIEKNVSHGFMEQRTYIQQSSKNNFDLQKVANADF